MNKTDKEQDREDIKLIITGVCSLVFAVVMLFVFSDIMGGFLLALVAIPGLIGAVSLLLGWQSYHVRRKWKAEEEEEQRKQVTLPNPTSECIQNNIVIGKASVSKSGSGVLHIALPIFFKKAFIVDVPDDVDTVVDGTIKGEVWFEDSFVDEVIFPLPLYGIPSNITEEVTLDGMCGRSVEYDGKYTVKITDNQNLWIMEA